MRLHLYENKGVGKQGQNSGEWLVTSGAWRGQGKLKGG